MVRRRRRRRRDRPSPAASLASLAVYIMLLSFSISPTVAAAAAVEHSPRRQKLQPLDETPPGGGGGGGGIGGKGWRTPSNSWVDVNEGELEGEARNARFITGDGQGACSANGGGNGKGVESKGRRWDGQAWGVPAPALEPSCHLLDRPSDAYSGAVKTIGGTMPDILQDSSWCASDDEACAIPPATAGAGNKEAARGGVDGTQQGTGSFIAAAGAAAGGNGGEAAACQGEPSIPGGTDRVPGDEARALSSGEAPPGRDERLATTSLADFTAAEPKEQQSRLVDGYATIATVAAYQRSRPPSATEQSNLPTASRPNVAAERPPQLEKRGPLVTGQGANTNTRDRDTGGVEHRGATAVGHGGRRTGATQQDGRAEEPTPGRWDRRANIGPAGGSSKGKGTRERELPAGRGGGRSGDGKRGGEGGVLEAAIVSGKAWLSWRAFACILVLSALVVGTYLRGDMPHWLPFLGGDRRQRWAIELDSAIAHARSRAGSFCSGRTSVFSGDPVDDSDVPGLISDSEEGEDAGNDPQGVVSGDDGEAPLMWDRRPKPDDYLVFHPVLGVVPAGVVRAWGGDGCGGWGGVRAEAAGARAGGTNGGAGGKGCGCSKTSSPRGVLVPGAASSKAIAVGGPAEGKQLPLEEWPEWLAARKATAAAAIAEVEAGKEAEGAATIRQPAAAAAVPTEKGTIVAAPVVVEGRGANDRGEVKRGGDGERTATATEARPAAASAGKAVAVGVGRTIDPQQQQPLGNVSRTRPAAIGLQFEDGCVNGGAGDSSTDGPRPLGGEDGDALSFVGGDGGGGAGSVGSCCSSEDNSIDVRAGDFSARRMSLSSEQPPAMTAAYHVS
ncbi:unnamed protein product [Ectocarpus fasciculatus]